MLQAARDKIAEVSLGFDASTSTRARVRLVDRPPPAAGARTPELGDAWCRLTVRAHLHRVGHVLRQDPRVGPRRVKSLMPEPLRDRTVAWPGSKVPMRIPPPSSDQDATTLTLTHLLRYRYDSEAKAVIYSLIDRMGGEGLAEVLKASGREIGERQARNLQHYWLDHLAREWTKLGTKPDAVDVERAKKLVRRK